jgi:formylglycine-generating enzyme required for sulfatase activity
VLPTSYAASTPAPTGTIKADQVILGTNVPTGTKILSAYTNNRQWLLPFRATFTGEIDVSDLTELIVTAVASGTAANTAVYGQSNSTGPADVTNAGGLSVYGTMGQGGNVVEWTETAYDRINSTVGEQLELRGGSWNTPSVSLDGSLIRDNNYPTIEYVITGFRVASVPEPSALSLLAVGLGRLALVRRRRS